VTVGALIHEWRRSVMALMLGVGVATLALLFGATPAAAIVAKVGGHTYGVTPVRGVNPARLPAVKRALGALKLSATGPVPYDKAGQLVNNGGPVMHSVTTHVIYWDPGGEFTSATKSIVHAFFTDVAHDSGFPSNVFAVAGQYADSTGNAAYISTATVEKVDKDPYPSTGSCTTPKGVSADPGPYSTCLFDEQLQTELATYIEKEALPTGPAQLYFLLLPHKVVSCFPEVDPEIEEEACSNNVFCAYHSSIEGGTANEIIYADIPFSLLDSGGAKGCQSDGNAEIQHPNGDTTGTNESTRYADVALKYTSHEYIEAATDPLGDAWIDGTGQEIGDKCNFAGSGTEPGEDPNAFLPILGGNAVSGTLFNQAINSDSFYLQSEWDNAGKACLMKPLELKAAAFTPSSTSQFVGSPVSFSGTAVDPYGGELSFSWGFGDGNTGVGASPSHTYAAPGVYTVSMTPKDSLTDSTTTPVEHTVTLLKRSQTTAFTSTPPSSATAGGPAYTAAASASSGLHVSFSSGTPSVCSVTGSTVTFAGPGTCTIDAGQAGDEEYGPAAQVQQSFAVASEPVITSPPISRLPSELTSGVTSTTALDSSVSIGNTTVNPTTGAITFTVSVGDRGTFSWLLTFQNGKFGVFAATNTKCKKRFVKLNGRCRPAKIVFAKGSRIVATAGIVSFTIKPSASGLKALRNASRRKKGLPVTATFTFQSSRGGSPVSHTHSLTLKLSRAGRKGKQKT